MPNILHFLLTAAASILLVWLFQRRRHLFIRPSLQIVVCYHILVQWPMAIEYSELRDWLPNVTEMAFLIHGFIWSGIAAVLMLRVGRSRQLWAIVGTMRTQCTSRVFEVDLRALLSVTMVFTLVYLMYVPLTETGLFVFLEDPLSTTDARESSLKLLESPIPKYAISFVTGSLAPLTTALIVFRLGRETLMVRRCILLLLMILVWAAAALSGAKGIIVANVLVAVLTFAFARRLRSILRTGFWLVIFSLMPAVLIAVISSAADIGYADVSFSVQTAAVFDRAFEGPFMVGTWFVHHAQVYGATGIAGFERFASILGYQSIDLPNLIGLTYGPEYYGREVLDSISATAGFVFTNYAYIGLWALPLNLVFLLFADVVLYLMEYVHPRLIVPMIAVTAKGSLIFAQSDYFTVWVTHGFGLVFLVAILLSRGWRSAKAPRLRRSLAG